MQKDEDDALRELGTVAAKFKKSYDKEMRI